MRQPWVPPPPARDSLGAVLSHGGDICCFPHTPETPWFSSPTAAPKKSFLARVLGALSEIWFWHPMEKDYFCSFRAEMQFLTSPRAQRHFHYRRCKCGLGAEGFFPCSRCCPGVQNSPGPLAALHLAGNRRQALSIASSFKVSKLFPNFLGFVQEDRNTRGCLDLLK